MCSAPYVASLSHRVLMSCQSQHHSRSRSDSSFIFPVLLLISLSLLITGCFFSSPSPDFCPTFISLFSASLSRAPVVISLPLFTSFPRTTHLNGISTSKASDRISILLTLLLELTLGDDCCFEKCRLSSSFLKATFFAQKNSKKLVNTSIGSKNLAVLR